MKYKEFVANHLSIPGFSYRESFAIWDFFLTQQRRSGKGGNLLEIGAFHGQSAVLLAMHAAGNDLVVVIEPTYLVENIRENLSKIKKKNILILKVRSDDAVAWNLVNEHPHSFRWVHIDGDHRASAVLNDVALADKLLAEDGIICVDDFFSPRYPGITYAVTKFIHENPGALTLFLAGYNKGYLARPKREGIFLDLIRKRLASWLEDLGFDKFTIFKTDVPGILNAFGIQERWQHYVYHGLDENPELIIY